MGSIRVTQRTLVDRVLNNISASERRILDLQDQLSTGRRVNNPSDDPLAARRGINAQIEIGKIEQYLTNTTTATPLLAESESVVLSSNDVLQRVRELTLQGANGTNAQEQLDAIATEIDQLLEQLLTQGNAARDGRFLFGGTRTQNPPFVETRNADGRITAVTYDGNDEAIRVEVSDGVRIVTNETGADLFTSTSPGTVDVFATLIGIRDALEAGNTGALTGRLTELDLGIDQLLIGTARLGSNQRRLDQNDATLRDIQVQLERVFSENVDADLAEVTLELNIASNSFEAALAAGARVIQPSLLDFLR